MNGVAPIIGPPGMSSVYRPWRKQMDPTQQAFLNAIKAAPDDDAPRLIYADWLDDHGESERAEFIRVSCRYYRSSTQCTEVSANWCPVCGDCTCPNPEQEKNSQNCPLHSSQSLHSEHFNLQCRCHELLDHFRGVLCSGTAGIGGLGVPSLAFDFDRGFLSHVRCQANEWVSFGDRWIGLEPLVRDVDLTTWPEIVGSHKSGWHRLKGRSHTYQLPHLLNVRNVPWLLSEEWPSITFHLPSMQIGLNSQSSQREDLERLRRSMLGHTPSHDEIVRRLREVAEFQPMTDWRALTETRDCFQHVIDESENSFRSLWAMPLRPINTCQIELRPFAWITDNQRVNLLAGCCRHGIAVYTPPLVSNHRRRIR